ncbi:MAG TPA: hypothetical protein VEA59_04870 [Patescibacteria group bacterium]|nr:hypothetical protein [Patescibacteria group bacterium]
MLDVRDWIVMSLILLLYFVVFSSHTPRAFIAVLIGQGLVLLLAFFFSNRKRDILVSFVVAILIAIGVIATYQSSLRLLAWGMAGFVSIPVATWLARLGEK